MLDPKTLNTEKDFITSEFDYLVNIYTNKKLITKLSILIKAINCYDIYFSKKYINYDFEDIKEIHNMILEIVPVSEIKEELQNIYEFDKRNMKEYIYLLKEKIYHFVNNNEEKLLEKSKNALTSYFDCWENQINEKYLLVINDSDEYKKYRKEYEKGKQEYEKKVEKEMRKEAARKYWQEWDKKQKERKQREAEYERYKREEPWRNQENLEETFKKMAYDYYKRNINKNFDK